MNSIKAKAIFLQDDKDAAEAMLEEHLELNPTSKMRLYSLKYQDGPSGKSFGGWAVASKMFFTCETKWETGYGMEEV